MKEKDAYIAGGFIGTMMAFTIQVSIWCLKVYAAIVILKYFNLV